MKAPAENLTEIEYPASANVVRDSETFAEHLNREILHSQNAMLVSADLRKSKRVGRPNNPVKTPDFSWSRVVVRRVPTLRRIGD